MNTRINEIEECKAQVVGIVFEAETIPMKGRREKVPMSKLDFNERS